MTISSIFQLLSIHNIIHAQVSIMTLPLTSIYPQTINLYKLCHFGKFKSHCSIILLELQLQVCMKEFFEVTNSVSAISTFIFFFSRFCLVWLWQFHICLSWTAVCLIFYNWVYALETTTDSSLVLMFMPDSEVIPVIHTTSVNHSCLILDSQYHIVYS